MRVIEQTSLALLYLALLTVVLIIVGFVGYESANHSLLVTPVSGTVNRSNAETVREATSLDGLKTVCKYWAEHEDQAQRVFTAQQDRLTSFMYGLAAALAFLSVTFGAGVLYIYRAARRLGQGAGTASE